MKQFTFEDKSFGFQVKVDALRRKVFKIGLFRENTG